MKKYLLVHLLIFSAIFNLSAQGFDFAPVGAKWYYEEFDYAPPWAYPHVLESVSKETFQGRWCSKIIYSLAPQSPITYTYTQNDTVYYYSFVTNQFHMLYDFTAEVGDSWYVGGLSASLPDPPFNYGGDTFRVDSISSLWVNGDSLKVWHIQHSLFFDWGQRIIEKVGNNRYFLPIYGLYESRFSDIRCFESPSESYHFAPYPCDTVYYTSVHVPHEADGIEIFPNPFHDAIYIRTEPLSEPGTLLLFNHIGNVVRRQKFSGSIEIETASLPAGIYFWGVEMGGVMVKRGKCVKE